MDKKTFANKYSTLSQILDEKQKNLIMNSKIENKSQFLEIVETCLKNALEKKYEEGYDDGYETGRDQGYDAGYETGRQQV